MNFNSPIRILVLIAAVFAFAGMAAAQGPVIDTASTTSGLTMSATFQTALQLDITTATATAGATVTPGGGGAYTLSLGNVNGLGLGTPSVGNVSETSVAGGYMYTTPIKLTPNFSGFTETTATITVYQDGADDAASKSAAREGAAVVSLAVLPAVGAPTVVTAGATTGTAFERFVGVFVANANAGVNIAGARSISLVYTITATP